LSAHARTHTNAASPDILVIGLSGKPSFAGQPTEFAAQADPTNCEGAGAIKLANGGDRAAAPQSGAERKSGDGLQLPPRARPISFGFETCFSPTCLEVAGFHHSTG
jgi:hypothetical protein